MKKNTLLFILILVLFISCQKKKDLIDLPLKVKIVKKNGLSVRKLHDSNAKPVGVVHYEKSYDVIDGFPGFYKISFDKNKTGWISASQDAGWTERAETNKVKILRKGGITIRQEPYDTASKRVGAVKYGNLYEILAVDYLYIKVVLPDNKKGWIYIDKPGNKRVEFLKTAQ